MQADLISDPIVPARAEWEAVVRSSPDALPFHAPGWVEAVCASGTWSDVTLLFQAASGGFLLVPMVERAGVLHPGGRRASLPHGWGFGGVVASPEVTANEFRAVVSYLAQTRFRQKT